ncbi:unnamed protein product [Rhizophagus irregularis]|nr:unnamed protein product [Rhizophagus irregularis]
MDDVSRNYPLYGFGSDEIAYLQQALLSIHTHFYNSASYTFQEENSDYQKINVCVGEVVGIASVKVESFAGVKAILKLPWNDGQDYIFTYYPFEDVSR